MVYLPSGVATNLNEFPLHSAVGSKLAIIFSSVFTSFGVNSARCPCQISSKPGDFRSVRKRLAARTCHDLNVGALKWNRIAWLQTPALSLRTLDVRFVICHYLRTINSTESP